MGKKDIIKIADNMDLNLDVLGYIDPDITVCYIRDGTVSYTHLIRVLPSVFLKSGCV